MRGGRKGRWAFSTNAFTDRPLTAALAAIGAVGYAGVEILADRPHLFPPDTDRREIAVVHSSLKALGLKPVSLNANTAVGYYDRHFWEPLFEPSLAHPDPLLRRWRLDLVGRALALARDLGVPHVSITSGRPVSGIVPERSLDLLTDSLRQLVREAAGSGVRLGIEYEPGLLVENAVELAALLARVDSPWLGANLDIGHSRVAGEELEEVLGLLGDRVFHVHLEDIRGRKHYHLVPGEGDLDFAAIVDSLDRHGYAGFFTVELYTCSARPAEAAAAALRHLEKVVRQRERSAPCASSNPTSIPSPAPSTTI